MVGDGDTVRPDYGHGESDRSDEREAHMSGEARFGGKVAIVTGAGSGIGRAVALRLTGEGAQVLAHDLNGDALAETAKLVADAGATVETRTGDISSRDECLATVATAIEHFGRVDVLGNIAGIARAEHFPEVEERAYRQMMGVNVDACFFLAQAAIPHLLEAEGNIVNIASNAGLMGQAYTVAYCMTKGAIVQLTKALAMEYAKAPLRVNAIAPGGVDTSLSRNFQIPEGLDYELMARYTGFRSMGSADDIAALFALVASDEGRSIHGAILSVDRGITAG
jgi:meso-butanediol dehydrogenase/(S,S)-butanediol dehydrogenase/diacetyl reductase